MGFNGGEAGGTPAYLGQAVVRPGDRTSLKKQAGTPAYPGRVAYIGQTLSHSPLKKRGGGEKQSYLYEKLF